MYNLILLIKNITEAQKHLLCDSPQSSSLPGEPQVIKVIISLIKGLNRPTPKKCGKLKILNYKVSQLKISYWSYI